MLSLHLIQLTMVLFDVISIRFKYNFNSFSLDLFSKADFWLTTLDLDNFCQMNYWQLLPRRVSGACSVATDVTTQSCRIIILSQEDCNFSKVSFFDLTRPYGLSGFISLL